LKGVQILCKLKMRKEISITEARSEETPAF